MSCPCKGQRSVPLLSLSVLTPVSNGQHCLVGKASADGLLEQLVCLLVHTCGSLVNAQDLDSRVYVGGTVTHLQFPTLSFSLKPLSNPLPPSTHPCLLDVSSSSLTLASVRRALARHSSCLCPRDKFRPFSPSSPSRPPASRTSALPAPTLLLTCSPSLGLRLTQSGGHLTQVALL